MPGRTIQALESYVLYNREMQKMGRPTKYDESMLLKAQAYVEKCQNDEKMPYIEKLALLLDIHDDTIVEWSKEHEDFSATVNRLKMLQKLYLKEGSLEKKLHAPMALFLLQANHGMGKDEKEPSEPISIQIKMV